MMRVSQPPRSRASSIGPLRSRRGCKTCKIRRVKCGEEKPNCLRCASTGRKCEYEGAILGTFSSASSAVSILENPHSLSANTVWRERRAFAYYFQHAASIVGGLDADFWSIVVPQVCRVEPAVWDAIIALSALFESREAYGKTENRRHALGWYSRSVTGVRKRIELGHGDVFIGLISCVLFICIEALQGSTEEAIRLYTQGIQLIVALRMEIACGAIPESKASMLERTIVPIFIRLAIMALSMAGVSVRNLLTDTEHMTEGFASLKAAREVVVSLAIEAMLFQEACEAHHMKVHRASSVPPDLLDRQMILLARVESWRAAFKILVDSLQLKNALSRQQVSTIALLTSYHEMSFIIISICTSPLKTITDNYLQNFRNIVDQSRIALDASAREDGTQPPFTFDIGVGFPIWFTCLRCADPTIRRDAIALLRRAPQVQGFYGNPTVLISAEALMIVEESLAVAINAQCSGSSDCEVTSADLSIFDISDSFTVPEVNLSPPPTSLNIPEEARIKPLAGFRPRDGLPAGLGDENTTRWNRGRDQPFLHFSRNEYDRENGTWREIHDCIPVDLEL
ncbi:Zn(II)2Cys6 transcription factor domain-containing protein [Aspergillus lucknowensis]|uniref:Zn(2)-C6 fungal-type domain-containing protein n=1 Tax=Aspergillus lucknowensis TaxID=176173 RepID=A0ABR4LYD4_9EURO